MPDPLEDTKAEVAQDLDVLIDLHSKRLEHHRATVRAYAQNLDVFVKDFTAMMTAEFNAIELEERTLHNLHSMKVGRPLQAGSDAPTPTEKQKTIQDIVPEQAPPPPPHMAPKIQPPQSQGDFRPVPQNPRSDQISVRQELGKVESEEQEKLRKHFEAAPAIAPGYPVKPPDYAVKGPIGETWSYKAGTDWGPSDTIDEKGHRHVHGRLCPKGHPNPLSRSDCVACKVELEIPKPEERRYRVYLMATGELLSDVAEFSGNVSTEGNTIKVEVSGPAQDLTPSPTADPNGVPQGVLS